MPGWPPLAIQWALTSAPELAEQGQTPEKSFTRRESSFEVQGTGSRGDGRARSVKNLISQVEGVEPDGEMYDARVKVMGEFVKHQGRTKRDVPEGSKDTT